MSTYRITRTTLRGQWENHACFVAAMVLAQATGDAFMIDTVAEPGSTGGPNDHSYTLWRQEKQIAFPPTCDPELISSAGVNGWPTEAAARAALNGLLSGAKAVTANVEAANAKAVSAGNIAASIGKDAAKVADAAAGAAKAAGAGAIILWGLEALAAGGLAWWLAKRWLGGGK